MSKFDKELILQDPDDPTLNLVITSSSSILGGKKYTFSIGRTYVGESGEISRTGWLRSSHIKAIRKLLDQVEPQLNELETKAQEEKKQYLQRLEETRKDR